MMLERLFCKHHGTKKILNSAKRYGNWRILDQTTGKYIVARAAFANSCLAEYTFKITNMSEDSTSSANFKYSVRTSFLKYLGLIHPYAEYLKQSICLQKRLQDGGFFI